MSTSACGHPIGARIAKFRRAEATVFVAGEFVTKAVEGPATPEARDQSWSLFSVAMVSLGAACLGYLNRYATGIHSLRQLFPNKWSLILTTDLVVRSERWGRLREDFTRAPPIQDTMLMLPGISSLVLAPSGRRATGPFGGKPASCFQFL